MPDFLSDSFGFIYDRVFEIYSENFQTPVFQYFFDSGFYVMLGMIFIFVPLLLMAAFYYFCKYPYGKWWHWLLWFFIIIIVVFGWTFGYANTFILNSNEQEMITCNGVQECSDYIKGLPLEYAKANAILSLFVSFIGSLILKRFSKIQTHLPF